MRAKKEENMEYKILKAAEKLFLEQGFIRTKMAQIAEEAGCNQALVHYYYRTKELLFEKIYEEKIEQMLSNLLITTSSDAPFEEKILNLISVHFEFLKQNPQLPAFSLNEGLNNSSENMTDGSGTEERNRERDYPPDLNDRLAVYGLIVEYSTVSHCSHLSECMGIVGRGISCVA